VTCTQADMPMYCFWVAHCSRVCFTYIGIPKRVRIIAYLFSCNICHLIVTWVMIILLRYKLISRTFISFNSNCVKFHNIWYGAQVVFSKKMSQELLQDYTLHHTLYRYLIELEMKVTKIWLILSWWFSHLKTISVEGSI